MVQAELERHQMASPEVLGHIGGIVKELFDHLQVRALVRWDGNKGGERRGFQSDGQVILVD